MKKQGQSEGAKGLDLTWEGTKDSPSVEAMLGLALRDTWKVQSIGWSVTAVKSFPGSCITAFDFRISAIICLSKLH